MEAWLDEIGDARAVLIAGPTASGKSRAAVAVAERLDRQGRRAVIVNADSMQVYDALSILSARPDAQAQGVVPHRLYGHVAAERRYSVGAWLGDLAPILADCASRDAISIVVGGTGLYFLALAQGLAQTPRVPDDIRKALTDRLAACGSAPLHRELAVRDPQTAATLRPTDGQRIVRALEVIEATGASLSGWREAHRSRPLLPPGSTVRVVMEPDRATLYGRIESRLDAMVAGGALDEVRALLDRGLAPDMPVMKAIGMREFAASLAGDTSLAEAIALAKTQSRRYAKRQGTWFRNQFGDWRRVDAEIGLA